MDDKAKAMVMASFLADSLALGAHWIYDTEKIMKTFGRVERFLKPLPSSYHPTKDRGDFTHYGDQAFLLLESVAAKKGFDPSDFSTKWRKLFDNYDGYVDQATRGTLSNYEAGKTLEDAGSPSNDLAGASRIAPIVYCDRDNLERLVTDAKTQTKMTHNNPLPIAGAEFFGRVCWHVLHGIFPVTAVEKIAKEQGADSPIPRWVKKGIESKNADTVRTISGFGQSCHTPEAFPGVVHLIAKYENDLREALIQSVMSGGDSAGRGMMVGMVLGAHLGPESLPEEWLSQIKKREKILELLEKI